MGKTFDPTKPVQTRDGRKARIICTDGKHKSLDFRIWALVADRYGDEAAFPYASNGKWGNSEAHENPMDLVNVPVRTSTWQVVHSEWTSDHMRKEKSFPTPTTVGYIRRDFEDGVFVGAEFEPLK